MDAGDRQSVTDILSDSCLTREYLEEKHGVQFLLTKYCFRVQYVAVTTLAFICLDNCTVYIIMPFPTGEGRYSPD